MFKHFANASAALSLMLSASAPAWAAKSHERNCPMAKHKPAKRAPVTTKTPSARGVMLVDVRKKDVQILSFGP